MKNSAYHKLLKLQILALIILCSSMIEGQSGFTYPPTGKLVDAGGHMLHIHVMGTGKPVVIFESGSADFSFVWDLVQPEVSNMAMTVSYDRAGYAWSEEGPVPRTGKQIAYELHTALHNAGIYGPYILVGQSFGGFLVRSFARFYKDEVVGMVLVDALNENERININNQAIRIREMAQGRPEPEIQKNLHKNTVPGPSNEENPLASNTRLEPPLDKLSPQDQKLQLWAQTQLSYFKAVSSEMDWSPEDVANMYENSGKPGYMLGDIPLIVLSKGKGNYGSLPDSVELEKERLDLQKDLAHLSTNSKNMVVRNSGHNIHLEDPAIVIDAIEQVIFAYKTKSKLK